MRRGVLHRDGRISFLSKFVFVFGALLNHSPTDPLVELLLEFDESGLLKTGTSALVSSPIDTPVVADGLPLHSKFDGVEGFEFEFFVKYK